MKKYLLLGVILLMIFFSFFNNEKSSANSAILELDPQFRKLVKEYEHTIDSIIKVNKIPGAALALVKDEQIYVRGFGVKKVGSTDLVDEHTVFRIGSVSKSFGALVTGILAEEGDLKWNDKVIKYLPSFALSSSEQTKDVNLEHLLSHTTGLPYHTFTNLVESGSSIKDIIPQLEAIELIGEAGKIYSYQNAAFSIIGEITKVATSQSFDVLLKEKVFNPLMMTNSSTNKEALMKEKNKAIPHRGIDTKWSERKISSKYYNAIPAGGINASISDMSQYLQLLIGNRPDIISEKTLSKIYKPLVKTPIKKRYFSRWPKVKEAWYAMGWRILNNGGDMIVYHGGFVNGYRSEIAINRKEKIGVCLLLNTPSKSLNASIPAFLDKFKTKVDSIETLK